MIERLYELAIIFLNWAFKIGMRTDKEYNEHTVKVRWNVTAILIMEKYFSEYGIKINPFEQINLKLPEMKENFTRLERQKYSICNFSDLQ